MKLRTRSRQNTDINLTPLIDVVFLLLIFFMVTTSFQQESRLEVTLPEASAEAEPSESDVIEIVISEKGVYYFQGAEILVEEPGKLRSAMQKIFADTTERPLRIRADANASHQSVVTVMDVAGELGINNLTIATNKKGNDK